MLLEEIPAGHRSGFVNIIGRPNVGKSTLMNALVGERMSIITNKPQTTRHRIHGLLSGDDFQIVFSDTPGIIDDPRYRMQEAMNRFAFSSFEDADLMLFVTEMGETFEEDAPIFAQLRKLQIPLLVVLNKIDLFSAAEVGEKTDYWEKTLAPTAVVPISALEKINTSQLLQTIKDSLPEGPAYYPKDQLTDRSERFFVSEIIREKILQQYHQEIPYSVEVVVTQFKEGTTKSGDEIVRIAADIYVSRPTQKSIIIGKGGSSIKKLGTEARKGISAFLDQKIFLELFVKVKDNWRDDERLLKHFGY